MPTMPFSVRELEDAEILAELAMLIEEESSDDEELVDDLIVHACEPMMRAMRQE